MEVALPQRQKNSQERPFAAGIRPVSLALIYALFLIGTVTTRSLWTDEAFSTYIADHHTVASLWTTLSQGDSSDLQTALYYIYLHFWTLLFGATEYSVRAANIPFIILFSLSLAWVSGRLFRLKSAWLVAGLFPFIWAYAAQARAYMSLLSFSMLCFAALLVYLTGPTYRERRYLPSLVLGAVFFGALFDMLMLLAALPILILLIGLRSGQLKASFGDWKRPFLIFAVPFAFLFGYFGWTFLRGTAYDYDKPTLLSMVSIVYRLAGLSGLGPNRRYDIPFAPYLPMILPATILLIAAAVFLFYIRYQAGRTRLLSVLFAACGVGFAQVAFLSFGLGQQVDLRHLAALVPLVLLLLIAGLQQEERSPVKWYLVCAAVIALVWGIADIRTLFLPENHEEDFRGAVKVALRMHRVYHADIALVADPIAGAYYGLDLEGAKPCFPLVDTCESGFAKVSWPHRAPADFAQRWTAQQIAEWLKNHEEKAIPMVVIISRGRHPSVAMSPWWPALVKKSHAQRVAVHGFYIYLL